VNNSGTQNPQRTIVQIRPGTAHAALGAIGGWKGTVLRSFSAGGVDYLDVAVSPKTIAGLSKEDRDRYYTHKLVFTRVRVAAQNAETLPTPAIQVERADITTQSQHEWYKEAGVHQQDPTRAEAESVAGPRVDIGRREAIRAMVGVGAMLLIIVAFMDQDCNNGNTGRGSWGHGGGFSS
jgi:hypothetical protein